MPELPEVETIARDLQKIIPRKTIHSVDVLDPYVVKQSKSGFIKKLQGQSILSVERRGKALIVSLPQSFLIIQPMMTGQAVFAATPDKHTRVILNFTDGTRLLYNDQRRFGHVRLVKDLNEINYFRILGPEPLTGQFTPDYVYHKSRKSNRPLKNFLLDHTVVAGIGNIYACEILFRSGISPKRRAGRLKQKEADILYQQIVEVLQLAIKHRGSSMRNYRDGAGQEGAFKQLIRVYAKENQPCPTCRKPIKRITQSGRSTFFCLHCQK